MDNNLFIDSQKPHLDELNGTFRSAAIREAKWNSSFNKQDLFWCVLWSFIWGA